MRILRNYILRECLAPFAIALGVLTSVFLLGYLPQLANKVINKGVSLPAVLLIFLDNVPVLLGYTLPIAALAAVILTFGRMSSDNEIIAIRASGIPLQRLLWPLAALGLAFSLTLLVLNDKVIPHAYHAQKVLLQDTGARNPSALLEAGTFIEAFEGQVIFIYRIDRNRLFNIRIYQPQDGKPTRTIVAREGEFTPVPDEQKVLLKLVNGTSDEPDPKNPNNFYKLNFKQLFMTLDIAGSRNGKIEKKPKGMTLAELRAEIARLGAMAVDARPLLAEYHRKITWSLSPFLFILLGFPVAVITHRRQKTANLLMAVLFAAPYYLMSVGCQALATQGIARPELIMWVPNILAGIGVLILNIKLCAS